MTQEEKAKRYDEAIEIAKKINNEQQAQPFNIMTRVFPELAESEDERMREHLIGVVELYYGNTDEQEKKDCLAWLDKQGEHKKFRDSIQVGDKVTRNEDGVLVNLSQLKRVAKPADKQGEQKPAYTKEYDFHGVKFIPKFAKGDIIKDKKCGEVSTIEDFSYDTGLYTHTYGQFPITIQDNYEIIAQKPAWSKEDEKIIRRIDSLLYSQCKIHGSEYEEIHNWLKSLRPQNTWKPSDGQIKALKETCDADWEPV